MFDEERLDKSNVADGRNILVGHSKLTGITQLHRQVIAFIVRDSRSMCSTSSYCGVVAKAVL